MEILHSPHGWYYARNAFDYKDVLKEAGFRWDADDRFWFTFSRRVALSMPDHLNPDLLAKLLAEEAAEVEALAAADAALPLLKPAGKSASQCIADVSIAGKIVRIKFAERDDSFREIVKGAGFRWAETAWQRTTTTFTGTPVDRAADIARSLLEAGFTVRVRDAAAHAKAISGEYEDEQTKWVTTVASGPKAGWLHISWAYDDDMYEEAKRLPGAISANSLAFSAA